MILLIIRHGRETLEAFTDKLEERGNVQRIIKKSRSVAEELPEDLERGGHAQRAFSALQNLEQSLRQTFKSRIDAPEWHCYAALWHLLEKRLLWINFTRAQLHANLQILKLQTITCFPG